MSRNSYIVYTKPQKVKYDLSYLLKYFAGNKKNNDRLNDLLKGAKQ